MSSSLDSTNLRSSLSGLDTLYERGGLNKRAKFGLLRKSVAEIKDLSQYIMYHNPEGYDPLVNSIKSFVSAKDSFDIGDIKNITESKRILSRPDAGTRSIENKVDALANQLAELSLSVRKGASSSAATSTIKPTDASEEKTCSYFKNLGHYATSCPSNPHRNTKCSRCGKRGHAEATCWKTFKEEKVDNVAAVPSNPQKDKSEGTASVIMEYTAEVPHVEVAAAAKRTADGESLPKQPRQNGPMHIPSLLNPEKKKSTTPSSHIKSKQTKNRKSSKKKELSEHVGKYDVTSELANAPTGMTFGQLIRGDGDDAKKEIRRMFSKNVKTRRVVAAPVSKQPRSLKIIAVQVYGTLVEALLDSGAVPNLISARLCEEIVISYEYNPKKITVADGVRTLCEASISSVPASFSGSVVSLDFLVLKNPPLDLIISLPVLEALNSILDFGKQQITLQIDNEAVIMGFQYATLHITPEAVPETDSEDYTSSSEDNSGEERSNEDTFVIGLVDDYDVDEMNEDCSHSAALSAKIELLTEQEQREVTSMLLELDTVAWDIKDLRPSDVPVSHSFELTDETPIHLRSRRLSPKHNEFVRKELDDLLDAGIIVPTSSAWSFPIVIASKNDGKSRFCVDYRALNRVMKADRWPLPHFEEIFDDLRGSNVFTTLDLLSGYWQIKLDESCKEKNTFVTRYGTFQFDVMPFGLMNAPSTFQRMMDHVIKDLPLVRVYVDDVVIFSQTMEDHMKHLQIVMSRISDYYLKVKLSKCFFAQPQVYLLGHVVDKHGVHVDDEKIQVIKNTPIPVTRTDLRSFLGLAGYYRRFICDFAKTSAVLHSETSGNTKLTWNAEMTDAFNTLKEKLTTPPVLSFPNFDDQFIVETDASNVSVGAVLSQKKEDGKVHPIQYASRTMTKQERNYSTCERDALAVIFALKKYRVYLLSSLPFKLITDHMALRWAFQKKDIHGRLARWLDFIAEYQFEVVYRREMWEHDLCGN